ncbi:MFS transporter [Salibacterium sp. K-3]
MSKKWAIYFLAFGGFVMGSAELGVLGIIGMIAQDTNVSVGVAGQLVSVYAIVFAIGSPILISLTSKMERKKLLLLSFTVFMIGNLLAFFSPNFTVLLISRIILASSQGVFTVVALTVGSSLVGEEKRGSVIGIILMGFSSSLVLSAPLGTLVGEYWGWHWVFMFIFILSVFAMIGTVISIPKLEGQNAVSLKDQFTILHDKRIISALLITFFWILGYQLVFTYISPFLKSAASLSAEKISVALFICGTFSVIGTRLGGFAADKWGIYRTLLCSLLLNAAVLFVLPWVATTLIGALFILAIWFGSTWSTTPVLQHYLVSLSPNSADLAIGLNNSVLQFGMSVGAGVGGWVISQTSIMSLGWAGTISVIIGLLVTFYSFSLKNRNTEQP